MSVVDQTPTYTREVLDGLAQLISDTGIAAYHPDTPYTDAETGVYFGAWAATGVRGVKLNAYQDLASVGHLNELYVQIATRVSTSYLAALDTVDALRDLLHLRAHFDLGSVRIALCVRTSTADLGKDTGSGLYEHTSNFRLTGLRWRQPITLTEGTQP